MVRVAGEGAEIIEGDTKTGRPRVVDLDPENLTVVAKHKRERGALALQLARPDALIFGDIEGQHGNPEHVSRQFARDIARCRKELGEDVVPIIRLHDLRHTHATLRLLAGVPVHVVSERLGHASPVVTMTVYAHVLPGGQQRGSRPLCAAREGGGSMIFRPQASDWHHRGATARITSRLAARMLCPRGDLNPHALLGH